jgi:hypothetical protein
VKTEPKKRVRPAINLSIDPALVAACRAIAKEKGYSLSRWIEQVVKEEIKKSPPTKKASGETRAEATAAARKTA